MSDEKKKEAIELGKKIIESQINTNLNTVKYDEKFEAFLVSNIIPTTQFFELRLDQTNEAILRVDEKICDLKIDMDKRFEGIDKKFEKVDERICDLKIDMDKRFEKVDEKIYDLKIDMDKRFEKIDKKFDKVDEKFVELRTDMDKRFDKIDEKFDKIDDKFDKLYNLLENRDKEMRGMILDNAKEQRSYTRTMFLLSITLFLAVSGSVLKLANII